MGFAVRDLGSQLGDGSPAGSEGQLPIPNLHMSHGGSPLNPLVWHGQWVQTLLVPGAKMCDLCGHPPPHPMIAHLP